MKLEIPAEYQTYLDSRVNATPEETIEHVVRQGIGEVWTEATFTEELRASVQRGIEDIEAGRFVEVDDVHAYFQARFQRLRERFLADHNSDDR